MKKYIYTLALASAFAATACHDEEDVSMPENQKELISFSMTDETGSAAAGSATRAGFTTATDICMRIRSTKSGLSNRYFVAQATAAAEVTATVTDGEDIKYSYVTFKSGYQPYWDDCYGRLANLSVFAVAVPDLTSTTAPATKIYTTSTTLTGAGSGTNVGNTNWFTETTEDEKISWYVSASQDDNGNTKPLTSEDLVYSNNIQPVVTDGTHNGYDGVYKYDFANGKWPTFGTNGGITAISQLSDGCMIFSQANGATADASGKFDKGHLIFNHALSRLTVKINCGESESGFDMGKSNEFTLSNDGVKFLGMNVKGVLDIEKGIWTPDASDPTGTITRKPARKTTVDENNNNAVTAIYYNTTAQMLPDYEFVDGVSTNVIQFTIDNNTYYVTQDMIFDALNVAANQNADLGWTDAQVAQGTQGQDGYKPAVPGQFKMKQGKNYVLNITVNKKKIEVITASLAPWADVNAEMSINNTHVKVTTSSTGNEEDIANHFLFKHEETLNAINTGASTSTGFSGDYKTGGAATLTEMKKSDNSSYAPKQYTTNWYYKDNMTAYHLRMLNKLAADATDSNSNDAYENISNAGTPAESSFKLENGAQDSHDYHWGAPMKASSDMASGKTLLKYEDTDGYKASLLNGLIAPTNDNNSAINITELHMMSNINVTLKTTSGADAINLRVPVYYTMDEYNEAHKDDQGFTAFTDETWPNVAEEDKIKEYNYAKVKITHVFTEGSVDMGIGKVTPTGTATDQEITAPTDDAQNSKYYFKQDSNGDVKTETNPFSWAVVPQKLTRTVNSNTVYVGITITTPDNNEYYVVEKLATIVPSSVGTQQGQQHTTSAAITQWYPNHTYNYTFTLSKKGIEAITCTLAEWVTVTGQNTNLTLED